MLLRNKDKESILQIAKQTFKNPINIWAYGSRVNGQAHDMSDLDLALISKDDEKIDIDEYISFKELLRDSNIPILIQVLDWNRIPKYFHKNILDNYEELI
ncbi:MAG: nucleotidyltransferase domain-containing protein [Campylobacterota bacterium]|nr:nucleotidyltransferase domain-containing protein [Campylobacterota bacterium]